MSLCSKAQMEIPSTTPSHMVLGCMGIASQYLNQHLSAIKYFALAYNLLLQESYVNPVPNLGFVMTRQNVEFNLIQALNSNNDFDLCLKLGLQMLDLPDVTQGGATVLTLSFVKWSPQNIQRIIAFGEEATRQGKLNLAPGRSLIDEVISSD